MAVKNFAHPAYRKKASPAWDYTPVPGLARRVSVPIPLQALVVSEFAFATGLVGLGGAFWNQTTHTAPELWLPIPRPPVGVITGYQVFVCGDPAQNAAVGLHSGLGLPATMPQANLFRQSSAGGALAGLSTVTDSSGSVSAYDSPHAITAATLNIAFEDDEQFYLQIIGERGARALNTSLCIYSANVTFDSCVPQDAPHADAFSRS